MTAHVLEQRSPAATSRQRRRALLAAGALLAVVLAAHGAALFDGPFFDDHWQGEVLRTSGWGWQDLTRAATFELPSRVNHLWWQDAPLQIRYARPLAMLVMKAEYAVTAGNPVALHALGLGWHWLTGLVVYGLARWALADRRWTFAAAALFVLNPHSVAAVGWIAAHNAVLSGLLLAAAMLVYLRASTAGAEQDAPAAISVGAFFGCLVLWMAAVLCRESAIVLPVLVLVADAGIGGWAQVRRRAGVHAVLWLLAGGYIGWRLIVFDAAQPPEPYFHAFDGAGYLAWAAGKMLRLLTALVFYTPMFSDLPSSGDWFRAALTYGLMTGSLLAIGGWYWKASREARGRWLWPAWTVAAFVPVVPVIMLPHFAYVSAAGWSIMLAIMLSRLAGRKRAIITGFVFVSTIWSLGLHRIAWRGIVRSEQIVHAGLLADEPARAPGTEVFFINLPTMGIYAPAAMRQGWGVNDVEGHVLTFAPSVLPAPGACTVEVLGPHELLVSMAPLGAFSGTSGRMVLDLTRRGKRLEAGETIQGAQFDVTVVEADAAGVRKVKFTFPRPLDSAAYRFYVSSPGRPAERLRFDGPVDVEQRERQILQWREANAGAIAESERYLRLMDVLGRVVQSDVFLTGDRQMP